MNYATVPTRRKRKEDESEPTGEVSSDGAPFTIKDMELPIIPDGTLIENVFGIPAAARFLGMEPKGLYEAAKAGRLKIYRVPHFSRPGVIRADLEAFDADANASKRRRNNSDSR